MRSWFWPKHHWLGENPLHKWSSFLAAVHKSMISQQSTAGPSSMDSRVAFSFTVSKCLDCRPSCQAASPAIGWSLMPCPSNQSCRLRLRKKPSQSYRKACGLGKYFNHPLVKALRNSSEVTPLGVFSGSILTTTMTWKLEHSSRNETPTQFSTGFPWAFLWGDCHQKESTLTTSQGLVTAGIADGTVDALWPRCRHTSHSNSLASFSTSSGAWACLKRRSKAWLLGWPRLEWITRIFLSNSSRLVAIPCWLGASGCPCPSGSPKFSGFPATWSLSATISESLPLISGFSRSNTFPAKMLTSLASRSWVQICSYWLRSDSKAWAKRWHNSLGYTAVGAVREPSMGKWAFGPWLQVFPRAFRTAVLVDNHPKDFNKGTFHRSSTKPCWHPSTRNRPPHNCVMRLTGGSCHEVARRGCSKPPSCGSPSVYPPWEPSSCIWTSKILKQFFKIFPPTFRFSTSLRFCSSVLWLAFCMIV